MKVSCLVSESTRRDEASVQPEKIGRGSIFWDKGAYKERVQIERVLGTVKRK